MKNTFLASLHLYFTEDEGKKRQQLNLLLGVISEYYKDPNSDINLTMEQRKDYFVTAIQAINIAKDAKFHPFLMLNFANLWEYFNSLDGVKSFLKMDKHKLVEYISSSALHVLNEQLLNEDHRNLQFLQECRDLSNNFENFVIPKRHQKPSFEVFVDKYHLV